MKRVVKIGAISVEGKTFTLHPTQRESLPDGTKVNVKWASYWHTRVWVTDASNPSSAEHEVEASL